MLFGSLTRLISLMEFFVAFFKYLLHTLEPKIIQRSELTRFQISNKIIRHGKYQVFLRVECVLVMFEHSSMLYANCFVLRFKRWHITFNGKQRSFAFLCCQFDFLSLLTRGCMHLDIGMGTSCCPYPTLLLSLKKMSNFIIIPAYTKVISNSTNCWNVSKYKLTWLNNPITNSVTLIVQYCLIRQTKIEMSCVGKLHQICLYFSLSCKSKNLKILFGVTVCISPNICRLTSAKMASRFL
jgi:hypothetical protein